MSIYFVFVNKVYIKLNQISQTSISFLFQVQFLAQQVLYCLMDILEEAPNDLQCTARPETDEEQCSIVKKSKSNCLSQDKEHNCEQSHDDLQDSDCKRAEFLEFLMYLLIQNLEYESIL